MDGVGVSIASLVFSFLEFGLFASQIIFLRRYWNVEGFRQFFWMTVLFVVLNLTLLLVSLDAISSNTAFPLKVLNSVSIAVYLFLINLQQLLPKLSTWRKLPWLLIALSLAFGLQVMVSMIQWSRGDMKMIIEIGVPVVLFLASTLLVVVKSRNQKVSLHGTYIMLLLFITFVFGSFLYYFENVDLVSYLYINFLFLLFSAFQYWTVINLSKEMEQASLVGESIVSELTIYDYGLTKTEIVVAEMVLSGLSYTEIAKIRHRTYKSITTHTTNIHSKVGVHSREEFIEKFS